MEFPEFGLKLENLTISEKLYGMHSITEAR